MNAFIGFSQTPDLPQGYDEVGSPFGDADIDDEKAVTEQLEKNGINWKTLQKWLYEIVNQPSFRKQMDEDCDYYDGNQIDTEILRALQERGQAPIIENLIGPIIDVVCGMEAKTRGDWVVKAEGNQDNTETAEALSFLLKTAETQSRADKACSDAYKDQIGPGLGWVYVGKNTNPFEPKYKVERIHRREIFWDWRAKLDDLSDARYLIRKRRVDLDLALTMFPEKRKDIIWLTNNTTRQVWDIPRKGDSLNRETNLDREVSFEEFEWFNVSRQTVLFYEVWYRQLVHGLFIKVNGKNVEFDPENIIHMAVVQRGVSTPQPAYFYNVRKAIWVANILVDDAPSPYSHRLFPYVRFYGYKEDKTNVAYGIVRRMRSIQDEVNARHTKMLWQLASVRTVTEADAVVDHEKTRLMIARPNAYVVLNPNRRNPEKRMSDVFHTEDGAALADSQFQLYRENKATINQVAGIYQSMLGSDSNAKSGVAINSLMEQGSTTTAEITDNYIYSRRLVGELLLQLIIDDIKDEQDYVVKIDSDDDKKVVVLNQVVQDEFGQKMQNDVAMIDVKIVTGDVPASPTYRQQQLRDLSELVKSLPPEVQLAVMPFVINATDIPERKNIVKVLKDLSGQHDGQDPAVAQAQQQIQQLRQQLQEMAKGIEAQKANAASETAEANATAQYARAILSIEQAKALAVSTGISQDSSIENQFTQGIKQ